MITTVISYCSLDKKFIDKNISECLKFSDEVIVVCCTHFLNGEKDTEIDDFCNKYKNKEKTKIILLNYSTEDEKNNPIYWHNKFRYVGGRSIKTEYCLFLDGDEVPDGDVFKKYLKTEDYKNYEIIADFICYYYFRDINYRSKVLSGVGLLIKKDYIISDLFYTHNERWFYRYVLDSIYIKNNLSKPKIKTQCSFENSETKTKLVNINGIQQIKPLGEVMFHHYSWVRNKEEMLIKVNSWGHKNDKNWRELINEEFSREFNGKCFVHGWEYEKI